MRLTARPFMAVTQRMIDGELIWLNWLKQGKPACIGKVWQCRRNKWWTIDGEVVDCCGTAIKHLARGREVDVIGWDWLAWSKPTCSLPWSSLEKYWIGLCRDYIIICIRAGTSATLASQQFLTFPAALLFPVQQHLVVLAGLHDGGV